MRQVTYDTEVGKIDGLPSVGREAANVGRWDP